MGLVAAAAATLVIAGKVTTVLDRSATTFLLTTVLDASAGRWGSWAVGVGLLALLTALATLGGALPARWALHRPMREELRLESGRHRARATPGSDLRMLLRIDRPAIWRSVPLRRGLAVLALMRGRCPSPVPWSGGCSPCSPGWSPPVPRCCSASTPGAWTSAVARVAFASRVLVLREVLIASAGLKSAASR